MELTKALIIRWNDESSRRTATEWV